MWPEEEDDVVPAELGPMLGQLCVDELDPLEELVAPVPVDVAVVFVLQTAPMQSCRKRTRRLQGVLRPL